MQAISLQNKFESLQKKIQSMGEVLVAFSGGVDSTFLLGTARDVLGEKVTALTAVSASLSQAEKKFALDTARQMKVRHLLVDSQEIEKEAYAQNPVNRCYFCKSELYRLCREKADELNISWIVDGFNKDDEKDWRPGFKAKMENNIHSPLLEAGLFKEEIRTLAKAMNLPVWDKPASPCLASRVPYGIRINPEVLGKIERLEEFAKNYGFRNFRVRYHEKIVRLEVTPDDLEKAVNENFRNEWIGQCKKEGFNFVTLDLEGFRSGRLNEGVT